MNLDDYCEERKKTKIRQVLSTVSNTGVNAAGVSHGHGDYNYNN